MVQITEENKKELEKINEINAEEKFIEIGNMLVELKYQSPEYYFKVACLIALDLPEMGFAPIPMSNFQHELHRLIEFHNDRGWDVVLEQLRFVHSRNEVAQEMFKRYHPIK